MKLKFGVVLGYGALAAASLCFAGNASADTLTGYIWSDAASYPADANGFVSLTTSLTTSSANYLGSVDVTNNTLGGDIFSFYSSTDADLDQFLEAGGDTVTGINQLAPTATCPTPSSSPCGINNDVMEFTGTGYLVNGTTYTFTKDDGMYLYINGALVPNVGSGSATGTSGDATSADLVSFTYTGTTGDQPFSVWYDELNGPPAELDSTNFDVTPEPSSLLLLGTGLLGLAFIGFRRNAKSSAREATLTEA